MKAQCKGGGKKRKHNLCDCSVVETQRGDRQTKNAGENSRQPGLARGLSGSEERSEGWLRPASLSLRKGRGNTLSEARTMENT